MAVKKPLVLTGGQIEQLQAGDSILNPVSIQLTNDEAGAILIGTPVYSDANDGVKKAQANAVGTTNVIGLTSDVTIAAGQPVGVQMDGILTATTGQWDTAAGTTGGLTKDTIYYLDPATAGKLTSTAPSTAGQFVVALGIAISTTELKIEIQPRVKL